MMEREEKPPRTRDGRVDHVIRHGLVDRSYHWLMATSVIVLLGTAFPPILGWKFPWVAPHWIAGVVLTGLVLFHIVRAIGWQDFWSMIPNLTDLRDLWRSLARMFSRGAAEPGKPGKYDLAQKLMHWGVAVLVLVLLGTGLLMLLKIDTPFWRRNPYWFADHTWGVIYAVHGLAAMALIPVVMIHVYFALRPEYLWFTRSMVRGWTRQEYEAHHDRQRWAASDIPVAGGAPAHEP
jgi:formate dehydrogenase subunit gamma